MNFCTAEVPGSAARKACLDTEAKRLRALCNQLQRQAEFGKLVEDHELFMSTTCTAATAFEGLLNLNSRP
jgi:hypothetical protein